MKKGLRKFVAVVLMVAMSLSVGVPAFAAEEDTIKPYAHDGNYKRVLLSTDIIEHAYVGPAGGQPVNGVTFPVGNGEPAFIWTDSGNETSLSFNVGYGAFSVGVATGITSVSPSGTGIGYEIPAPAGVRCKLFIDKDILVKTYGIYYQTAPSADWRLESTYTTAETYDVEFSVKTSW